MTVTYSGDVGNASSFGCFNAILLKWRGSVYKLIYKELCAYIIVYFIINLVYRHHYIILLNDTFNIIVLSHSPTSSSSTSSTCSTGSSLSLAVNVPLIDLS